MIPYKQLSLADIFTDCQEIFENDKPAFLSLLETSDTGYFFMISTSKGLKFPVRTPFPPSKGFAFLPKTEEPQSLPY